MAIDFSQKVSQQLQEDVQEIDRALRDFLDERLNATRLQDDAFRAYENDMKEIEDLEVFDQIPGEASADQNVYRSNSKLLEDLENTNSYDLDFDMEEEDKIDPGPSQFEDTSLKRYIAPVEKKILSFEERNSLRSKMFDFLESCREEEAALELEYERSKNLSQKEANMAADKYFGLQKRNAVTLKTIIDDYQPVPFSKAWGNDADYMKLTTRLKNAMIGDENINMKAILKADRKKKMKKAKQKS